MSLCFANSFKLILDEMKENCSRDIIPNCFEFKELLASSNSIEKYIIAKYFCDLPWNFGSLRVLGILQELRILTATEFVLSIPSDDQVQLILNDFLEAEFNLLANLYISATYDSDLGVRLNEILNESSRRLFNDLLQNPKLNDLSFLKALKSLLPGDVLQRLTLSYIDIILDLHRSNTKTAFSNLGLWINKGVNNIIFTQELQKTLICDVEREVLEYLFKISTKENFGSWKFYIILLQAIASNCKAETSSFIRNYLKERILAAGTSSESQHMLHILLTARVFTATTLDVQKNIAAYAEWYRQNIAEIKFLMKTEEFQNVCSLLEECIEYEMEEEYLRIHATISISPPVLCGKIVQNYKAKCKLRLSQIKGNNPEDMDSISNNTIVIDD